MPGRYWVLASDELMDRERALAWPEGLRPVERGAMQSPGMRWWLFEDAAASRDGKPCQGYEITFTQVGDRVTWDFTPIPPVAPCCDMHNRHCEAPGDLCCGYCTEARHGFWTDNLGVQRFGHPAGEICASPDLPVPAR